MTVKDDQAPEAQICPARPPTDHYPTPPEMVRALLSVESFPGGCWEPCAGSGDMAAVLREAGHTVRATTIEAVVNKADRPRFRVQGGIDFLTQAETRHPNIITNPPFRIAEEIVRHALSLRPAKVSILLNMRFLASVGRTAGLFRSNPPARVWLFGDRTSMYPAGYDGPRGSSTENYCWIIWESPQRMTAPTLGFLLARDFKDQK